MRNDPPDLPDEPYDGYDGPRGFADVDGGYPIEDDSPGLPPRSGPDRQPADVNSPASPVAGRRLHNPLPPAIPATDHDDEWYGPEPDRARWKVIVPIAVLAACVGLGVWLALPPSQQAAPPSVQPGPASPTAERMLSRRPVQDQATRRPTPTARTETPPAVRTPAPSRTPTPTSTRPSSTAPSAMSTVRPSTTPPAQPRRQPQPTATFTQRVTITVTPTVTPTGTRTGTPPVGSGPEEPPRTTTRPSTGTRPSPTCVTWGDCHDDPPKG
ncbi:MAG TPA: hypothetical protein VFV66_35850 [Nonomuraea sp.]|nr:hypothetical protein [Nonomuraea sp.]